MKRKEWIGHALKYIDKFAAKIIVETTDGNTTFGYELSRQVLEDALNGREL